MPLEEQHEGDSLQSRTRSSGARGAINSEFDALLAQNTTAGAGLDGVQMKLARVEACVGRGDRRELAAATADVQRGGQRARGVRPGQLNRLVSWGPRS